MKWYVINYDFNRKKLYHYNIFDNVYFLEDSKEIAGEYYSGELTLPECYKKIERLASYCFRGKREYELSIGDAFEDDLDKYFKVSVYDQLEANMGLLTHYILNSTILEYHN